jgi:hypothetical protein
MDIFYVIVPSIAICILILMLTYIGIRMANNSTSVFPPQYSTCPDYWTVTNGICTIPDATNRNYGALASVKNWSKSVPAGSVYNSANGTIDFSKSLICDLKKWANGQNVTWDGVSNYNSC